MPRWTGLAGMILIAGALVTAAYWGDATQRAFVAKLQADGHQTTAKVLSKSFKPALYARPGGTYAITVQYTDHTGRQVLAETFVSEAFFDAAQTGDELPFWYLDGTTRRNREWILDQRHGIGRKVEVWALALFLIACGAYTFMDALRREGPEAAKERKLRRKRLAEIATLKKRWAAKSDNTPKT